MERHSIIAREGWPHALLVGALAVAATWLLGWWSIPFWVLLVFVLQFFRDPARTVAADTGVVSPADGRVVFVGKARDPYLDRDALKISVFMNVFNVHSNRVPVSGTVEQIWYHPGSFLNAALDKSSLENERLAMQVRGDDGVDVTVVQVAGLLARRIFCYVKAGGRVERGQRYGFIRFGSRVDLYLPASAVAKTSVGDVVTAGVTIVAALA